LPTGPAINLNVGTYTFALDLATLVGDGSTRPMTNEPPANSSMGTVAVLLLLPRNDDQKELDGVEDSPPLELVRRS
jgi:hypothetical protein